MRRIVLAALLAFPALSQDAGKRQFEALCAGCHGEQTLRDPGSVRTYTAMSLRLRDGQTFRGVAKNESAFDLQLFTLDGRLHQLLWHFNTGAAFRGGPMTYLSGGERRGVLVAQLALLPAPSGGGRDRAMR